MHVGFVGLGNMGTAVGNLIAKNGYNVLGWEHHPSVVEDINTRHMNSRYLPDIPLHANLRATSDLPAVWQSAAVVFIAIPSAFIKTTLQPLPSVDERILMVNMAKGIDRETGLTSFQTISGLFPHNPRVMFSGPTIAAEFAREMPTKVVLAGMETSHLLTVSRLLDNEYFRTRFSDDTIGVELGGILKNVYAIGLGLLDGKSITSINFRAVYLTLAMEEIARFGVGLGAKLETFLYLAGVGDLLATALSEHSHNRRMGQLLVQGMSLQDITHTMGVLPEGYNTLSTVLYIGEKLHISVPLAKGLADVITGRYTPEAFMTSFMKDFFD